MATMEFLWTDMNILPKSLPPHKEGCSGVFTNEGREDTGSVLSKTAGCSCRPGVTRRCLLKKRPSTTDYQEEEGECIRYPLLMLEDHQEWHQAVTQQGKEAGHVLCYPLQLYAQGLPRPARRQLRLVLR